MSTKLNISIFTPPYDSWATKIKLNCKYINKGMMLATMCVMLIMEEIRKVLGNLDIQNTLYTCKDFIKSRKMLVKQKICKISKMGM